MVTRKQRKLVKEDIELRQKVSDLVDKVRIIENDVRVIRNQYEKIRLKECQERLYYDDV